MTAELPAVIARYLAAVNAFDTEAIAATFAEDAYVTTTGARSPAEAIRAFSAKELAGDLVTMEVVEVADHYGDTIVRRGTTVTTTRRTCRES